MALVIVAAWGSRGDVVPHVAVAVELRKRGHEVTLVANPAFESLAREASLSFLPVGTVAENRAHLEDPALWEGDTSLKTYVKHLVPTIEGFYHAVESAHRPGQTVLVSSTMVLGAWIAAEKLALPSAHCLLTPTRWLSRLDPAHPARRLPVGLNAIARSPRGLRLLYALRSLKEDALAAVDRARPPHTAQAALVGEIARVRTLAGVDGGTPGASRPRP